MHLKKIFATIIIVFLAAVSFTVNASAEDNNFSGYLVGLSKEVFMPLSLDSSLEYVADGVIRVESLSDVDEFVKSGLVEYIEPNYYVEMMVNDNINDVAVLQSIYNSGGAYGQIKASVAAMSGYSGAGIRVAVIDSGLNIGFGDFNESNIELYTVYSDGKFYDSSMPNADHGTRVADIIAGIHGNGIGVDGIAPDAAIVSIKVFDSNGDCTIADLNTAIYKAVNDYNCDIINLSLGSENNSTALRTAIQYALSNGVIVVAASGNDADKGNPIMYPASYDGVISVGAAGADYSWQSYSCYNEYVDCVAPGTLVYRLPAGGGYSYFGGKGTSYASPAVAAIAALMLQSDEYLTPEGLAAMLRNKTMDLGCSGRDVYYGYGFVRVDWLLDDAPILYDTLDIDSQITISVVIQTTDISNVIVAEYAASGQMLDIDIIAMTDSSFCLTYPLAGGPVKLFFLDDTLMPISTSLQYPSS